MEALESLADSRRKMLRLITTPLSVIQALLFASVLILAATAADIRLATLVSDSFMVGGVGSAVFTCWRNLPRIHANARTDHYLLVRRHERELGLEPWYGPRYRSWLESEHQPLSAYERWMLGL